jgi:hypothetical protein
MSNAFVIVARSVGNRSKSPRRIINSFEADYQHAWRERRRRCALALQTSRTRNLRRRKTRRPADQPPPPWLQTVFRQRVDPLPKHRVEQAAGRDDALRQRAVTDRLGSLDEHDFGGALQGLEFFVEGDAADAINAADVSAPNKAEHEFRAADEGEGLSSYNATSAFVRQRHSSVFNERVGPDRRDWAQRTVSTRHSSVFSGQSRAITRRHGRPDRPPDRRLAGSGLFRRFPKAQGRHCVVSRWSASGHVARDCAYTSRSRDAERAKRGLPPLSGQPLVQSRAQRRA